jgi:hypothetical protein
MADALENGRVSAFVYWKDFEISEREGVIQGQQPM